MVHGTSDNADGTAKVDRLKQDLSDALNRLGIQVVNFDLK